MSKKILVKQQDEIISELTRDVPDHGIFSVGNDSSATLELPGEQIASEQLVIVCEGNQATLMCRADGVQINNQDFPQGSLHNLLPNDVIRIGDYTLIYDTAENIESLIAKRAEPKLLRENIEADDTLSADSQKPQIADEKADDMPFQRSLNDILEELRADEKFYFQTFDHNGEKHRFYVESEEMWLGWSASNECVVSVNAVDIEIPLAQVRKDWSGVVLYPLQNDFIRINKTNMSEPHRLKNDDHLMLLAKDKGGFDEKIDIRFHEPTALLVLDSILPKTLPPPVSIEPSPQTPEKQSAGSESKSEIHTTQTDASPSTKDKLQRKLPRFFGYFTLTEIMLMLLGTLIASVIIFLILEYS